MRAAIMRWFLALSISMLVMGALLATAARAQEAVGVWHGSLSLPTGAIRIGVKLTPAAGGDLEGAIFSPDQSGRDVPLEDVRQEGRRLSFAYPAVRGRFEGDWDASKSAWVGTWTNVAGSLPLILEAGDIPKGPTVAGLDGDWEGVLTLPATKLRIVLHVRTGRYGTVATLDSPDQIAFGLPVSQLARSGQTVSFRQTATRLGFSGTLSADDQAIVGELTQAAVRPLTLTRRAAHAAALRRPQTPRPPFPYKAEEVTVESAPGVRLAGTLTLPPGKGPFPAAVLITGSGAQDRDETIFGHKPFAVLADDLTRRGVAVLRYDDRGFARSTGDFVKATSADFAVDAAAATAYLRARPEIDPDRVGLIGHSEGGVVAPMAAAKDPRLGFVVLIAAPAAPILEAMFAQQDAIGPVMGIDPERIQRSRSVFARVMAAMKDAPDQSAAEARAREILVSEGSHIGIAPDRAGAVARQLASDWRRTLLEYDPAPNLRAIRAPVLAVNGSKDVQVVPEVNLPAIRTALGGNRNATILELPGLNHMLQTATTGAMGEYNDIEETIAPAALKVIGDWVAAHARADRP